MRFEIDVDGIEHAEDRLEGVGRRASDLRPVGAHVIGELAAGERRLFATPAGWAPLAQSTKERKRRQRLDSRPMHATGLLAETLGAAAPGERGRLETTTRTQVIFGIKRGRSDIFYGRFHHQGRGVPRRRVIVATQRTQGDVRDVVTHYLLRGA